jgi:hypothetical protein
VIERHELRPAGAPIENPKTAFQVGAIGRGSEILFVAI